jgi:hypothetical protein
MNISVASTDGNSTSVEVEKLMKYSEYTVQVLALLDNSSNPNVTNLNETIRASQKVVLRTVEDGKHFILFWCTCN